MPGYDATVMTTYGVDFPRPLQYEVTEVAIVRLDDAYAGKSFVILDGPFACIDPLPGTKLHLVYDVDFSVHHRNVGMAAEIPPHLVPLIDSGPILTPHTRVKSMLDTLGYYMRSTLTAVHIASLFTVRAVLPNVEGTDERPTLLARSGGITMTTRVSSGTLHVLSGKISSAVAAAERVVKELS
jgi:hypothetical protein